MVDQDTDQQAPEAPKVKRTAGQIAVARALVERGQEDLKRVQQQLKGDREKLKELMQARRGSRAARSASAEELAGE